MFELDERGQAFSVMSMRQSGSWESKGDQPFVYKSPLPAAMMFLKYLRLAETVMTSLGIVTSVPKPRGCPLCYSLWLRASQLCISRCSAALEKDISWLTSVFCSSEDWCWCDRM